MEEKFLLHCQNCDKETVHTKPSIDEYCSTLYFGGFSFFGGSKFYTYKDVLLFFGIRKRANTQKCVICKGICFECPYCFNRQSSYSEKCEECKRKFIICE